MRKMLCLLLMLAMLTPCLPALAEDTDALDVILLSSAEMEVRKGAICPTRMAVSASDPSENCATSR